MNWEAIGSVADVIAAGGVIVTLLYLAVQIKEQNRQSRLTATRELARDWGAGIFEVARDPEMFDLYMRAVRDYEGLAQEDRLKAYWMFSSTFRTVEIHRLHFTEGHFSKEQLDRTEYRIKEVASLPGVRQWWSVSKEQFSSEFIEHVEQVSSIAEVAGANPGSEP